MIVAAAGFVPTGATYTSDFLSLYDAYGLMPMAPGSPVGRQNFRSSGHFRTNPDILDILALVSGVGYWFGFGVGLGFRAVVMVGNGFRGWEAASVMRGGNRIYNADTRVTTNRLSRRSGNPEPFPSSNRMRYAGRHPASPRAAPRRLRAAPRRVFTTSSVLAHNQGSGFPLRRE